MKKPEKVSSDLGFFRFKKLGENYLLTNDLGEFEILKEPEFKEFIKKGKKAHSKRAKELSEKGFLKGCLDEQEFSRRFSAKNDFLKKGTSLHIIVVTLRCNHKCLYCHASAESMNRKELDMDKKTAKAVVDTIFQSPNKDISIEFQGGEPLVNLPVVKFIIEYAQKKNQKIGKNLLITIVSNLSLMDQKTLDWFFKRRVIFCTSIDGPAFLHDQQRIYPGGQAHDTAARWIGKIQKKYGTIGYRINALPTTTKLSLAHWREIVDEYVKLGLPSLFLRYLNPFGLAQKTAQQISYTPEEFIDFYRRALDYIIELNLKGENIKEGFTSLILQKIFKDASVNFLDLRSPCGAGIGQMAYNYNGDVYTCDEGRMMSQMGDESFRLGNVFKDSFADLVSHPVVKSCCIASNLEGLPACCQCAYKPYCGVCPVYNYKEQGNIFSQIPNNQRCKIMTGIFDAVFEKLQDEKASGVFQKWLTPEIKEIKKKGKK